MNKTLGGALVHDCCRGNSNNRYATDATKQNVQQVHTYLCHCRPAFLTTAFGLLSFVRGYFCVRSDLKWRYRSGPAPCSLFCGFALVYGTVSLSLSQQALFFFL